MLGHVFQLLTLEGMTKTIKYNCCSNNTVHYF